MGLVEQQETDFPVLSGTQHHRQGAIVPIFPPIPIVDDPSQPWFFVGNTRHLTEVDGGFRTMGVQLTEFLNAK